MKPIAVISGDIHYSLKNLALADDATRQAIQKANELKVPFIANGDTTDTKAILRAECVNAMIETFKLANLSPYINIGNHCKINSKGSPHALNFLSPYAVIIDSPKYIEKLNSFIIPYYDDVEELRQFLKALPKNSKLIMHQGLNGTNAGEYIRDHSALNPEDLVNFRTILSHYHCRQDIKCGSKVASYIGSPYTVTFGEANDPEKGYQILYDDGSLEFVPTNLRKHIVINCQADCQPQENLIVRANDLVWVKVKGPKDQLSRLTKEQVKAKLNLPSNFKLDLIPDKVETTLTKKSSSQKEVLDQLIDSATGLEKDTKKRLKQLWKSYAS